MPRRKDGRSRRRVKTVLIKKRGKYLTTVTMMIITITSSRTEKSF